MVYEKYTRLRSQAYPTISPSITFIAPNIPTSLKPTSAHGQKSVVALRAPFTAPLHVSTHLLGRKILQSRGVSVDPLSSCKTSPTCALATIFNANSLSNLQTIFNSTTLFHRFGAAALFNVPLYSIARVRGQKALTSEGLNHALGLGILLWTTCGVPAYIMGFSFLILGSVTTRIGSARKEKLGIAEKRGGRRGPENLWGAAGACAICAILSGMFQTSTFYSLDLVKVMHVALCGAVASKSADTVSSEIGKAFGKNTYLITSFKAVPPGTEGAISAEGTLAGITAAFVCALLGFCVGLLSDWKDVAAVSVAGTLANFIESIIGEKFQDNLELTNEQVNFINTSIGAIAAGALTSFLLA